MNPCFLLAYGVEIESLSAFIFILCTVTCPLFLSLYYYCYYCFYYMHWEMTHFIIYIRKEMTHFISGEDPLYFERGPTFSTICMSWDIHSHGCILWGLFILTCCHICGMFIITRPFSFKHIAYFLECVCYIC